MKRIDFFAIIYSILVLLKAIIYFWYANKMMSFFFEIIPAILLFITTYFFFSRSKISMTILFCITFFLMVYYGYVFFIDYSFINGIMTAISAFFAFDVAKEFFYSIKPE